jgi:hypothetical protein
MRIFKLVSEFRVFADLRHGYMSVLIRLKVMRLTMTPVMSTNSRLGSQCLLS